jgi:hypothetical protein
MILQHYQDLAPAQQQAVLARLGLTAPASASAAASPPQTARLAAGAAARPGAQALAAPAAAATPFPTPVSTDVAGTAPYRAILSGLIPKLNGLLGVTYTLPIVLAFDPSATFGAYTRPVDAQGSFIGPPTLCPIYIGPNMNARTLDSQRLYLAHELMHCYQAAIDGNLADFYHSPLWLIEGSAEWAGATVTGAPADLTLSTNWLHWLCCPGATLFSRSYDALGFYALLDQAGVSPWSVLPAMYKSQSAGQSPSVNSRAAYHAAQVSAQMLDQWASSYERDAGLGTAWDLHGPAILPPPPSYAPPLDQAEQIANGGLVTVATPAFSASDFDPIVSADVLQISISGSSRLHDGAQVERVPASGSYCFKPGGCTCPPGSTYQGPPPPQLQQTPRLYLALSGGEHGAAGLLLGETLQQFCAKTAAVLPLTIGICQHLLSVDEANQLMRFPIPVVTVDPNGGATGGTCNYRFTQGQHAFDPLLILFEPWTGPVPIPQQTISAAIAQLAGSPGVTVTTYTLVSGIGDQAASVAASGAITSGTATATISVAVFYVLYQHLLFGCANVNYTGTHVPTPTAADVAAQSALQQCAQLVLSRIDP